MAERRSKRARVVDYAALDSGEFIEGVDEILPKSPSAANAASVDFRKWSKLILKGEYGDKTKVLDVKPEELEDVVRDSGFQNPILVKGAGQQGLRRLGIRLPEGNLTVDRISDLVGPDHPIPIIDVASQAEGPKWTLESWRYYWNLPPVDRKKLLNVVSLGLFGTPMETQVTAPSVVRDMDLVGRVWPIEDFHLPKVQLYVLMSPQGAYTDFHVDMGGSSVWYHLVGGRKVFLIAPPSAKNLEAFEEWASSDKQGSVFFGSKGEGWRRLEMEAGDTLLMPGGWPHAVVTPEDSIAVGGNFQTGQNFTAQVNVWKLEDRLRVRPKFRYPSFKRLMWYAAYYYVQRLHEDKERTGGDHHSLSRWEASGLRALLGLLKGWQVQSRGDQSDVPPLIPSADILLHELEELLPPPPSPRLITIKRTDSSASGLDKNSLEKAGKVKPKAQSKPPPRPAHKGLGVKGRLLAKLGMKRSQPILSLPRIHTEKPPLKSPPAGDTSAKSVADVSKTWTGDVFKSKLGDVGKSRLGALRIDVGGGSGECNAPESVKGERYSGKGESTSGSGNSTLIRIPKVVIRGLRGLGSPRGTLGEEPRGSPGRNTPRGILGEKPRGSPEGDHLEGGPQAGVKGFVEHDDATGTKQKEWEGSGGATGTKRKEPEGNSDGTGSDSLGASEKDFAKLLIRLGKRTGQSDTTSRSESPFSEPTARPADVSMHVAPLPADVSMEMITSAAADVSQRVGETSGAGKSDERENAGAKGMGVAGDAFASGHELSRFAAACLMTSGDGASGDEKALGVAEETFGSEDGGAGSPGIDVPGSRYGTAEGDNSTRDSLPGSRMGMAVGGVSPADGLPGSRLSTGEGHVSPADGIPGSGLGTAEAKASSGDGLPGSRSGVAEGSGRPGDENVSNSAADVESGGADAIMRGFLSALSRGHESLRDRGGGNDANGPDEKLQTPKSAQSRLGQSPVGRFGRGWEKARESDARGATRETVSGSIRSPGATKVPWIPTGIEKPVAGPTGILPSPRGGLLSPRRPPLPSGILDRSASRLTLGMKNTGQKRRAIMLTEVKPDPEVLAQKAKAAADAQKLAKGLASGKKPDGGSATDGPTETDGKGLEVSGAGGASVEVGESEGLDRSTDMSGVEREDIGEQEREPGEMDAETVTLQEGSGLEGLSANDPLKEVE